MTDSKSNLARLCEPLRSALSQERDRSAPDRERERIGGAAFVYFGLTLLPLLVVILLYAVGLIG